MLEKKFMDTSEITKQHATSNTIRVLVKCNFKLNVNLSCAIYEYNM